MLPNYYVYPAFLYYDSDGISIEFPDLPGCLPCGSTTEEALHNAKEAQFIGMVALSIILFSGGSVMV